MDKLFAICDYYLGGRIDEHSRHLYDLFKMSNVITINSSIKELFQKVKEERKVHKTCLSAQDGVDIKKCLQEIIEKDIYFMDYTNITSPLIFDKVGYDIVRNNLANIINSDLFK